MLNKLRLILLILLSCTVMIFSCKEKQYGGEDMINYPDMETILTQEVDMIAPYNYLHVQQVGDKIDSMDMPASKMPWEELKGIFKKGNLHKEALNFKYAISIMQDTMANTRTLYYEALAPDVPTRSISIVSNASNDQIQNIYLTMTDKNPSDTRVLLIPNQLIQIQKRAKEKTVVDTYYYP